LIALLFCAWANQESFANSRQRVDWLEWHFERHVLQIQENSAWKEPDLNFKEQNQADIDAVKGTVT
jgi:hypothetical protein